MQLGRDIETLLQLNDDMKVAIGIIERQIVFKNSLWIHRMASKGIGKDISSLVADVRWAERTGRIRMNTWARTSQERRRTSNLMGYQFSSPPQSPRPQDEAQIPHIDLTRSSYP
jgi:hypothetical protein